MVATKITIWECASLLKVEPRVIREFSTLEENPFPLDSHLQADPEAVLAWLKLFGLTL